MKTDRYIRYNKDFDDVCWIDQILDALDIKETFVAGVSNGGYLVQLYSLCRPERVRRGISISSALSVGKKGGHMATMMKMKSIMENMNNRNDPRANLLYSLKPYLRDTKKDKLDQYVNLLNVSKIADLMNNNDKKK